MTGPTQATQGWGIVVLGTGAVTVASRARLADRLGPRRGLPWVLVALGARQVAQGSVLVARPRTGTLQLSAAADALHAVSLVSLLLAPGWRRFALWSAATAVGSAAVEAVILRTWD